MPDPTVIEVLIPGGVGPPDPVVAATLAAHISDTDNPHVTTAEQLGLENVDNTSDSTKNSALTTLTNKTISADDNDILELEVDNFKTGVVSTDTGGAAASNSKLWAMAAAKTYIDSAITAGFKPKAEVRTASTVPVTLATGCENGDTVGGVVLATGNRFALMGQAAGAENGLYTCNASGSPTRATDADTDAEIPGAFFSIAEGTHGGEMWFCSNTSVTIGVTSITFILQQSALTLTAGPGVVKTGNEFSSDIADETDIAAQTVGKMLDVSLVGEDDGIPGPLDAEGRTPFEQTAKRLGHVSGLVNDALNNSGTGLWAGTPATATIQAAINDHVINKLTNELRLPSGGFFIEDTLHVVYQGGFGAQFFGSGMGYANTSFYGGTKICCNFVDRPILSIQNTRMTRLGNISLQGPLRKYIVDSLFGTAAYAGVGDDRVAKNWVNPIFDADAVLSSRAPFVGLSIDGYCGSKTLNITAATKANPIELTLSAFHYLKPGDPVSIESVVGMTELNGNSYKVNTVVGGHAKGYNPGGTSTKITLKALNGTPVDSTGFGTYVSGGAITLPHYPDVAYPSAPTTQYGKSASYGVYAEYLDVEGVGVGYIIHANASDGNGDFTPVFVFKVKYSVYGMCIPQTQARRGATYNIDIDAVHTGITNRNFGKGQGQWGDTINGNISGCIYLYDFSDPALLTSISINLYCESVWAEGILDSSSSAPSPFKISGEFKFGSQQLSPRRGVPTWMVDGTGTLCSYIAEGARSQYYGCYGIRLPVEGIFLDNLFMLPSMFELEAGLPAVGLPVLTWYNATGGGFYPLGFGVGKRMGRFNVRYRFVNLNTGVVEGPLQTGGNFPSNRRICTPVWCARHRAGLDPDDEGGLIPMRRILQTTAATIGLTGVSVSGRFASGVFPAGWTEVNRATIFGKKGDAFFHSPTESVFIIDTRSGDNYTLRLLNRFDGVVAAPVTPITFTGSAITVLCSRYYSPERPIYGIITSGSAVITEAGSNPGSTQDSSKLLDDIAVGDWVIVDKVNQPYLNQTLCNVTAIDETAGTFTLGGAGAAIASSVGRVRFLTFARAEP